MYHGLALVYQQMFQTSFLPKVSEKEQKTGGTYLILNEKGVTSQKIDSLND